MELTTTSILALFDTNKEQRQTFIENVLSAMEAGDVDPLKIHYQLKCVEKIIEEINKTERYRPLVLDAAEKWGQKEFEFNFSKIKIGEVGTKYDYSQCNDAELFEWQKQQAELKAKIDQRQKMLQTIPAKGLDIVTDQGETYTVYPPAKSSTTSVIVTLK